MEMDGLRRLVEDPWIPWSGLEWGHQSTAKTMVEAWVELFGWIHGVDLKSEPKRAAAALLDPLPWL